MSYEALFEKGFEFALSLYASSAMGNMYDKRQTRSRVTGTITANSRAQMWQPPRLSNVNENGLDQMDFPAHWVCAAEHYLMP